jgi:hypothetical protein
MEQDSIQTDKPRNYFIHILNLQIDLMKYKDTQDYTIYNIIEWL